MKFLTIIFSFLVLNVNIVHTQHVYDSTKISPNVLKIVKKLSKYKTVEGVFVGMVGTPSETYQLGKKLRIKSTRAELEELTFHPSPLVRVYSFWGMAERNEPNLLGNLIDHLHDTVKIHTLFADAGDTKKLCDFLIEIVVPKYIFKSDYTFENKKILNEQEKHILDSIIIFTDNNLVYTGIALTKIKPNVDYYERVKELAARQNIYAIVALSKYHNYDDTALIMSSFDFPKPEYSYLNSYYYTFWAFSEFPNKCFENFTFQVFDSLVSLNKDERYLKTLYKAIASFKNPFFQKYLETNDKNQNYYSFLGMTDFACDLYDSLMFNIWDTDKIITEDAFHYLYSKDKIRSIELIIKTIEPENEYLEIPGLKFWIDTEYESVLNLMFDTLYSENKVKAIDILNDKLRTSDYEELEFYCTKAKDIKDSSVFNTILQILKSGGENTFDSDNYWFLMEVLVSFNDAKLDVLIINSILQNEYAVKKRLKNRKSIIKEIELMRWGLSNSKSLDQLQLDKYR